VRAGDTLYSIAWESGRDYQELADWNQIIQPYTIRPGQVLRLFPPTGGGTSKRTAIEYHVVVKGDTLYRLARDTGVSHQDLAAWNRIPPPYTIHPGQKLRVTPPDLGSEQRQKGAKSGRVAPTASTRSVRRTESTVIGPWAWPTDGKLLTRFNANGTKGIDIDGRKGQPIHAAAPGSVVYQGSGLRGYGQLIIIKHNAEFLSAYAHNSKIVVQEGNMIKRGQKIAEMGSSGTNRIKLHFEIRHRGVPVDPLKYLPKQ
jgi:lipoprotein NlpD